MTVMFTKMTERETKRIVDGTNVKRTKKEVGLETRDNCYIQFQFPNASSSLLSQTFIQKKNLRMSPNSVLLLLCSLLWASPFKVYFSRLFRCLGVFLWGNQIQTDQYLLSLKGLLKRLLTTNCLAAHPCLISGSPKVQEEMNAVMGHFRRSSCGFIRALG